MGSAANETTFVLPGALAGALLGRLGVVGAGVVAGAGFAVVDDKDEDEDDFKADGAGDVVLTEVVAAGFWAVLAETVGPFKAKRSKKS